jgi:putative ABC transport system substrate-binding protein
MKRRTFIAGLGSTAAWPVVARAQQPAVPVVGMLSGSSFESFADRVAAFRQGLGEIGFVEGRNVAIEYRSADGRYERAPALAADLVRRQVAVIVAIGGGNPMTKAARTATSTIPIVFAVGGDPVIFGLVASISRPEANVTGVAFNNTILGPKRLDLMRQLLPGNTSIGYLDRSRDGFEADVRDLLEAARITGQKLVVFTASTAQDIDIAFAAIVQQRVAGLLVSNDASLSARRDQIVALAARQAVPTIYGNREYVRAGGLLSYGAELHDAYRWTGVYTGRILKGEKPADLPVFQSTKFELAINLKTAKALGLTIPETLLAIADEVIQ